MDVRYLTVGKIVNTHGLRGEVKVMPQTDFADTRFKPGNSLILMNPENQMIRNLTVKTSRLHKNVYILQFAGMEQISEVEKYKGWLIKVSVDALDKLPQGEYYYHEIVGCAVFSDEGEELGTISEILSPGANDVWVVNRVQKKPIYVPVIDPVVLEVDVPNKRVLIHLMEGMLE